MYCHATGWLILPWGVSTDSSMNQELVGRAGFPMFERKKIPMLILEKESNVTTYIIMETRMFSISCAAALLVDWGKSGQSYYI